MCEKLFRGKRIDNGEWVEGCGIIATENWVSIFTVNDDIDENSSEVNEIEVLPETVGQYTGLTVANGKVFNGDIIRFGNKLYLVFWNGEAFQWQAKRIDTDLEIHRTCGGCHNFDWTITDLGLIAAEPVLIGEMTTEIIGNKWDNPELLTRSKGRCNNAADEFF